MGVIYLLWFFLYHRYMVVKIQKGRKRPKLLTRLYIWFWSIFFSEYTIIFYDSSKYKTPLVQDQLDINKLFGYYMGHPHVWSVRWGWRYDIETDLFILYEYRYIDGLRYFKEHYRVKVGEPITLGINKALNRVYRLGYGGNKIYPENIAGFSTYPRMIKRFLGVYYGGIDSSTGASATAPNRIEFTFNKKNMWEIFNNWARPLTRSKVFIIMGVIAAVTLVLPLILATALFGWGSTATIITSIVGIVAAFALVLLVNKKLSK